MKTRVLCQIGLAVALGMVAGYLLAVQFNLWVGLLSGCALAFVLADMQTLRLEGPIAIKEFWMGFCEETETKRTPENLLSLSSMFLSGVRIRNIVDIVAMVSAVLAAIFLSWFPSMWGLMRYFPSAIGKVSPFNSAGEFFAVGFLATLSGMLVLMLAAIAFGRVKNPLLWPLTKRLSRRFDPRLATERLFGEQSKKSGYWLFSLRRQNGSLIRIAALLRIFGSFAAISLWPLLGSLLVIGALLVMITAILDALLTLVLRLSTSRNTAAGICAFIGIVTQYFLYPAKPADVGDIVRLLLFSIAGGVMGIAVYALRQRLLAAPAPMPQPI